MKKFSHTITTVISTSSLLLLSGCTTPTGTGNTNAATALSTSVGIGKAIFKTAVDTKCRNTMTNNQYWKAISPVLSQAKRNEIQTSVCGCVSAKSVENVTPTELATAVIDQNARNELVVKSVNSTFNGCYGEITKSLNLGV